MAKIKRLERILNNLRVDAEELERTLLSMDYGGNCEIEVTYQREHNVAEDDDTDIYESVVITQFPGGRVPVQVEMGSSPRLNKLIKDLQAQRKKFKYRG